jgi:hypothetical protein
MAAMAETLARVMRLPTVRAQRVTQVLGETRREGRSKTKSMKSPGMVISTGSVV